MLSIEEYFVSWGLYLLASLGLMLVWWRMTARIPFELLRNLLRLTALVALLMPYPVPNQEAYLAPAIIMSLVEGLFYEEYGLAHAGIPLLTAVVMANVLYLVLDLALTVYRRKRAGTES